MRRSWHFCRLARRGRGANARRALALDRNAAKGQKGRCPRGCLRDRPGAALNAWGIAIPRIPAHAPALRQVHLEGNDTHSDLWDALLNYLKETKPKDAFALIGITMTDLYPSESWNFVFGQANYRKGVGIFSFARYGDPETESHPFLARSIKVMSHEIGHMFGLMHCVHFQCLMNGSNSLYETDRAPQHLCPVCLRKLQDSAGFYVLERYACLKRFYAENGFDGEKDFLGKRIQTILDSAF